MGRKALSIGRVTDVSEGPAASSFRACNVQEKFVGLKTLKLETVNSTETSLTI